LISCRRLHIYSQKEYLNIYNKNDPIYGRETDILTLGEIHRRDQARKNV